MNAHINGNMWDALIQSQPYDTLKKYKKKLLGYQVALNNILDSVYAFTFKYKYITPLHKLSFGLDKYFAKMMMKYWRRRQINIALLPFHNPKKRDRRLKKLSKKMVHLDKFAIKWLC